MKSNGGNTSKKPRSVGRKIFSGLSLLFVSILLFHWAGCSDEPTSVGSALLSSQNLVTFDSVTIIGGSGTSSLKRINTGASPNLLIGRDGGYESSVLLKFVPIPDTLKTAVVDSAVLKFKVSYRVGQSPKFISVEVHKMTQGWTEGGVTWDSITTASYAPAVIGRFEGTVADSDSVSIKLDPELVTGWFQVSGTEPIHGIVLVPTAASTGVIGLHSFQAFDLSKMPWMTVYYTKNGARSTILFLTGQDAYLADVKNLTTNPNLFYVQSGVAYRSFLKFNLTGLPPKVGIHNATLELTGDKSTSRLDSQSIDSLLAFFLITADSIMASTPAIGRRLTAESEVYTFPVTASVQRWNSGRENLGFQIEALAESSSLGLFTLFTAAAEVNKRPRLKIFYSRLP